MYPSLELEETLWNQGIKWVAGVDEVGRGAIAGPLVAAAVVFPKLDYPPRFQDKSTKSHLKIRDSKRLTCKNRAILDVKIKQTAFSWAIGQASVGDINQLGIVKATHKAMRRAVSSLPEVGFVLVDAFTIPYLKAVTKKNQKAVKKGDQHCLSIAAASIIAKVHRDRLLIKLGKKYPAYGLEKHKGYGTKQHKIAIEANGAKRFHRTQFTSSFLK